MKWFISLFLSTSIVFASDSDIRINISSDADEIFLNQKESKTYPAAYIANNNFCVELEPTHGIYVPVNKEKHTKLKLNRHTIQFKPVKQGMCKYKFANILVHIGATFEKNSFSLTPLWIYQDDNGGDDSFIVCKNSSRKEGKLVCRSHDSDYGQRLSVRMNFDSSETKTIKVIFE